MDIIVLEMPAASVFRVEDPSPFSILKLRQLHVPTYQITCHHKTETCNLVIHCCENLKYHITDRITVTGKSN
jgi:hypothetical protein